MIHIPSTVANNFIRSRTAKLIHTLGLLAVTIGCAAPRYQVVTGTITTTGGQGTQIHNATAFLVDTRSGKTWVYTSLNINGRAVTAWLPAERGDVLPADLVPTSAPPFDAKP